MPRAFRSASLMMALKERLPKAASCGFGIHLHPRPLERRAATRIDNPGKTVGLSATAIFGVSLRDG
jgi:hypothetical protein